MQAVHRWLTDKSNKSVILLLVGGLLFRVVIAIWLYPGFDEAYYYLYTLHPDLSYFDHPPLVALTTGFGPWLTHEVSQFTIRLGSLILHTGALVLLYLTGARLFSTAAATFTLAIASLIPIFLIAFGVLTLPDNPLIFFWTASLYCAAIEFFPNTQSEEFIKYRPTYRLAILGLLIGLACLGKYHGFILAFGIISFCLTSRYRSALTSPWALLGLGLFFVAISPILIWNYQHDWISLRFQSERGVPKSEYNFLDFLATFLVSVAYLFPTLGLPLWWVSLKAGLAEFTQRFSKKFFKKEGILRQKKLLILWVSLPLIVGFTWLGGYTQILPTWAMPGFWGASLLLGQQVTIWQKVYPRRVKRWLKVSAIALISLVLFALLHLAAGTLQKPSNYALFGGFISPKDDPSTQLFDVKQLRQGFVDSPVLNSALQKSSFIFTNRYYLGGQIGMALAPIAKTPITTFDKDIRGFAFWSSATQWLGKDALYITPNTFARKKKLMDQYKTYFETIENIGSIPIKRGGSVIEVFQYQPNEKQVARQRSKKRRTQLS
jgi:4-amino-4-deoxy-L-arabinose transferase-like glycosyltransferase